MPYRNCRILAVGDSSPAGESVMHSLSRRGAQQSVARTVQEAILRLRDFPFDVVLACEALADGRAYELMPMVERKGSSLLVAVALSESALWLPVVENGRRVLGSRALNARMLESELERLLSRPIRTAVLEPVPDGATAREGEEARQKILARRIAALPLHLSSYDSLDARRASFDQLSVALAGSERLGKENRREPGRFERAERRAALGNRRTA
jgi:CheY-like chemotaxis protein